MGNIGWWTTEILSAYPKLDVFFYFISLHHGAASLSKNNEKEI